MTEIDPTAPAALFGHCVRVYGEMAAQAKVHDGVEGTQMLAYEGRLTDLIVNNVGLSVPYYTRVTQALKGMGSARQLRRGGGPSPSLWELVREPTIEMFDNYMDEVDPVEIVEWATAQSVRDLTRRIQNLEKAVGI